MERTDWLDEGFDSGQARFLMVTAITHHRFSSSLWGEDEVRKLHAEMAEIELAAAPLATETEWAGASGYREEVTTELSARRVEAGGRLRPLTPWN